MDYCFVIFLFVTDFLSFGYQNDLYCSIHNNKNECWKSNFVKSSNQHSSLLRKKWLNQIFTEAKAQFSVDGETSFPCKTDFFSWKQHLEENQTSWAVQMYEASEWPQVGLLAGRTHHFGNWGECINAKPTNFKPRYCLVDAKLDWKIAIPTNKLLTESSMLMDIQKHSHGRNKFSKRITWALCVPSSCGPTDLKLSLDKSLNPVLEKYNLQAQVDIDPKACGVIEENVPFSFVLVGSIYGLIVIFNLSSLMWNFNSEEKRPSQPEKESKFTFILNWFSLKKNVAKLMKFSTNTTYPLLYFVNGIISVFVVGIHRIYFYYNAPQFSNDFIENMPVKVLQLLFGNLLDFNFVISGYLLFNVYQNKFSKFNKSDVAVFIIFRWLRKMIIPAWTIPIIIFMSPYLDSGPLYSTYTSIQVETCKSKWWEVLLAVNNFGTSEYKCFMHTWFTSVEVQLTIIGSILLFVIIKSEKMGLLLMSFIFIFTTIAFSANIYLNEIPCLFDAHLSQMDLFLNHPSFRLILLHPFSKIGPYLLGFFTSYVVQKLKKRKYQFSMTNKILIMSSSTLLSSVMLFFRLNQTKSDPFMNAILSSTNHIVLMLPFACFLCIFYTSGFGSLDKMFSNQFVTIYGRLLNCVFLTGPLIQFSQTFSQYTPATPTAKMLLWLGFGDLIVIWITSFLVHVMLEIPSTNTLDYIKKRYWK